MDPSRSPGRPRSRSAAQSGANESSPAGRNRLTAITTQPQAGRSPFLSPTSPTNPERQPSPLSLSTRAPPSPAPASTTASTRPRGASFDETADEVHFQAPRRAATSLAYPQQPHDVPRRARGETSATQPLSLFPSFDRDGLRRRSTAQSRHSRSIRVRPSGVGERSQYPTLAGPEVTPQLVQSYENYVSPGYTELNPAYEQPAAAKPVWSLAKPLPRVVRSGMIPTKSEILQARQNAVLPAENSQNAGVDIDPNDLEAGRVKFNANPAKLGAQIEDMRAQREQNLIASIAQAQAEGTLPQRRTSRASTQPRISSQLRRTGTANTAAFGHPLTVLPSTEEQDEGEDLGQSWPDIQPTGSATGSEANVRKSHEQHPDPINARKSHEEHLDTIPEGQTISATDFKHDDDASSVATLAADLEDFPELDDLHKIVAHPSLMDEVHNNHTSWSVVRMHHREFLAELLAVYVQLSIGFSVDIAHTVAGLTGDVYTAFGWGFATMVAIYLSGGVSGAHLSPVITTMLWFFRGFPKRKMPEYFLAQFLGAFLAAFTTYGLYYTSIQHYLDINDHSAAAITTIQNGFVTSQRNPWVTLTTAYFNEFYGTAMLVIAVLAFGDDQNSPPTAGLNGVVIGFLIALENFAFSNLTGAALNTSRDFGPRLALLALGYPKTLFTNPYWVIGPFLGTFSGMAVGATVHDVFLFVGGESPINYPWARTTRSFRKTKARWRRRLLRTEREAIEDTHWNTQ